MLDFQETLFIQSQFILAFTGLFLFLYFFKKLTRVRHSLQEMLLFLGIELVFLFLSISAFLGYWENSFPSIHLRTISELLSYGSVVSFFSICEYRVKKTRGFVTLYSIAFLVTYTLLKNFAPTIENADLIVILTLAPAVLLYLVFLYMALIKPTSGYLRTRMYFVLIGFFIGLFGLFMTSISFRYIFGPLNMSFSRLLGALGLCIMGYGLAAFSTFSDFTWKDKLRELFVISPNGICLYAFSFEKQLPLEDSDLVAGGFSGIQLLLSEIIKTHESLQLIDYQNVKIMVEQGGTATFILIIKAESSFMQYKLRLFSEEFQNFFKDNLRSWTGETDVFLPTKILIQRVFEQDFK